MQTATDHRPRTGPSSPLAFNLTFPLFLLALLIPATVVNAQSFSRAESREILAAADALVTYPDQDFSAEYTVTEVRPGEGTSRIGFVMFRRDRNDIYTILIQEPSQDKGKGYLKIGDNLSLYDPVARRFTSVSASDRFEGTDARNSDFTQSSLATDYEIVDHTTEELGAYATDVYDLEALHDDVTFPIRRIWVDESGLVRKAEDYSLSRRHMRTTAIPDYRRIGDRYVPIRIVIQDELRGRRVDGRFQHQRTLIEVAKPSFQEVPDMVFSRTFLERVSD
ncbi:MAG: outer membrane lipoprotein-sorting protein [Alkalispirochaeta sp.]